MPEDVIDYDDFLASGDSIYQKDKRNISKIARNVSPDTFCMMVYTSGTTGKPKGAMYSHKNLMFMSATLADMLGGIDHSISLSFLPMCHIAERLQGELVAIRMGNTVKFASIATIKNDLVEVRPTILLCVPRLWEKFYDGIQTKFAAATGIKKALLDATIQTGLEVSELYNHGNLPTGWLDFKWNLLQFLVVKKLKIALGLDRCHTLISGAAPLAGDIVSFFGALGLHIREVYGQTESTGVLSANPKKGVRAGTVGVPLPGVEVSLDSETGEILCRGPNVFLGYYKNDQKTQETIDPSRFLHTGDVGKWTEEGYLKITDRLKDIIVTAGGKNVAPQNIEGKLKLFTAVSQACVIGDKRKYLVVLITLDPLYVETLCDNLGIAVRPMEQLIKDPKVIAEVQSYIDQTNSELPRHEQLKKFRLLAKDFSVENGEVTPTLKMKRRVVMALYKDIIDELYPTGEGKFANIDTPAGLQDKGKGVGK
eukprot:TRINITY_DN1967_c0_g1_i2.p1 TRINITY_DN1967_c0_g1~~TRINITY_DN1967_c0_g1_i2.p1  ORF type:complete len:481 (-),score=159.76 TRINITY_DN1967_c0_g1_i2:409-1851(-)